MARFVLKLDIDMINKFAATFVFGLATAAATFAADIQFNSGASVIASYAGFASDSTTPDLNASAYGDLNAADQSSGSYARTQWKFLNNPGVGASFSLSVDALAMNGDWTDGEAWLFFSVDDTVPFTFTGNGSSLNQGMIQLYFGPSWDDEVANITFTPGSVGYSTSGNLDAGNYALYAYFAVGAFGDAPDYPSYNQTVGHGGFTFTLGTQPLATQPQGTQVPDGGMTLILLGSALGLIAGFRRFVRV